MEKATFAAGCFWGIEDKFRKVKGVQEVFSGYMGGSIENPTYEQVCQGDSGHAEVVQIEFDPSLISFENLLELFWNIHDPTSLNKQGPDAGTQYRSEIFYHIEDQKIIAEKSRLELQKKMTKEIVTNISKASQFYKAEEYHQCYLEKNGLGSCH